MIFSSMKRLLLRFFLAWRSVYQCIIMYALLICKSCPECAYEGILWPFSLLSDELRTDVTTSLTDD